MPLMGIFSFTTYLGTTTGAASGNYAVSSIGVDGTAGCSAFAVGPIVIMLCSFNGTYLVKRYA